MKLGKMLSVGEIVEHTTDEPVAVEAPLAEAPLAEAPLAEAVRQCGAETADLADTEVAEVPAPVAAHADR